MRQLSKQFSEKQTPHLLPCQQDRVLLVRQTQELLDLNSKIQAAIIRSRLDKHVLLSHSIKSRELDGKVKRAV